MNKIKSILLCISLCLIFLLKSALTEAALHPYYTPKDFHTHYNINAALLNSSPKIQENPLLRAPTLSALKRRTDNHFTAYFNEILPGGEIWIKALPNGKIDTILVAKEIDGFVNYHGKRVPKEILNYCVVEMVILTTLGYPTDKHSIDKGNETFLNLLNSYPTETVEYLYNPALNITYCVGLKRDNGRLYLYISTPAE